MTVSSQITGALQAGDWPLQSPTVTGGVHVESLVELLRLRASEQPDSEGYRFLGSNEVAPRTLSYRALDRQARAIGAYLSGSLAPNDRVLLLFPTGPEFLAAFFGCLYANVIAVPAYPPSTRRPDGHIAAIAADAGASVVLTTERTLGAPTTATERYPALRGLHWIAVESLLEADDTQWEPSNARPSDLAYLQYTSGSTSTPRGVMISHANVLHNLEAIRLGMAGRPQTGGVTWAPLFHDLGLVSGVLVPLYQAFPMALMSPTHFLASPLRWLQAISASGATSSSSPNFGYDLCVERTTPAERAALDLSTWNLACVAAEPIRPASLERFAAAFADAGFRPEAFWPAFGLAEATLAVTPGLAPTPLLARAFDRASLERGEAIPPATDGASDARMLATSGCWPPESEVVIVDPDAGTRLLDGRIGEIWFKSGSVGQGYWNRPVDSDATFQARLADSDAGPFLRTGDLGFVHDNELFVTGRLKDLIVIRGRNHAPHDLEESAEASHPELRRTCVAAVAVERDGEEQVIVVAEVRRRNWPEPEALAGVADAIRMALAADHQIQPAAITLVGPASLSKTSSGKLKRGQIRETWQEGGFTALYTWERPPQRPVLESTAATPRTRGGREPLLPALLDCIGRELGADAQGVTGDHRMLDLCLDSLRLVHLILTIEQQLGLPLPFAQVEDNPTLQELAARLAGGAGGAGQRMDLWAEAALDGEIQPPTCQAPPPGDARTILLTGATGFLGAHLLREIVDQTTAHVYCLVRADDEQAARVRLRQTLESYGLWNEQVAARILPVPGDLSQPGLGLHPERFAALASELDVIYHNGAWLNFVHPYARLKPVNVDGTREVLRLACHGKTKAVHYVSTAGVFYGTAYDGRSVDESEPLRQPEGLDLGYVQSKWVAEQLVWQAARRGLPVSVYRPGWILGDSRTGRSNGDDFFGRLLQGCIQLRQAPRAAFHWRAAPVDYVAHAIVAVAIGSRATGRAFHLTGSDGVDWEQLVAWTTEAGYPLDLVAYDRWLAALRESDGNALLPLLPFFAERAPGAPTTRAERYAQRDLAHLDGTATRRTLPAHLPACPPLDADLLRRYLAGYAARGLLRN